MFKPSENNFGLPKSLIDSVAAVLAEKAPPFGKKDDKKKDAKADSADGDKKDDKKPAFGKKKDDKGDSDKKPAFGKKDDDSDEDDKKPAFGDKKADGDEDSDEGDGKKPAFGKKKSDDDGDADDDEEMIGKDGKKTKVDLKPKLSIKENARSIINEISSKALKSYLGKSRAQQDDIQDKHDSDPSYHRTAAGKKDTKTSTKRYAGEVKAIKKLNKEEVTLTDKEIGRIEAIMAESKQFDKGDEPADHKYDSTKDKGPEHIIMQLRKAKSLGSANKHIEFNNGKKVKVDAAHVHKALDMHASFKRAPEKDEFTKQIAKSHDHLVRAVTNK
jgi:hypothetical protein